MKDFLKEQNLRWMSSIKRVLIILIYFSEIEAETKPSLLGSLMGGKQKEEIDRQTQQIEILSEDLDTKIMENGNFTAEFYIQNNCILKCLNYEKKKK